jgi:hypothetical protein
MVFVGEGTEKKINNRLFFSKDLLSVWTNSAVTVERVDQLNVFGGQLEVPDVKVLLNPRLSDRFRNGDVSSLHLVLKDNLCWRLVVLVRNFLNFWVVQKLWIIGFSPWPIGRPQRTVRRDNYIFGLAKLG